MTLSRIARTPWLTSALLFAALALAWAGERTFALGGRERALAGGAIALLFVISLALRWWRGKRIDDPGRALANRGGLLAQSAMLLAPILYIVWTQTGSGSPSEPWLLGGWLSLSLIPLALSTGLDLLLARREPVLSEQRVKDMGMYTLACSIASLAALPGFQAARATDHVIDLAYNKSASPGDETRNLFRALASEPGSKVEVHAFLSPNSDLSEPIAGYFNQLAGLSYQQKDQLIEPRLAEDLGVRHNRVIAISTTSKAGERRTRQVELGDSAAASRAMLRDLDLHIARALRPLARSRRTVYLLRGHEELSLDASRQRHKRISRLAEVLEPRLNIDIKPLGASDGLAMGVPEDAAAVLLLGPERAYLEQEVAALSTYLDNGGSLLVAIEPSLTPEVSQPQASLRPLLQKMSVRLGAGIVASKQSILPLTRSKADRLNLITRQFEPHPAIASLAAPSTRDAVLLPSAGFIETLASPDSAALLQPAKLILTPREAWVDLDDDLEYTPPEETRRSRVHAIAISPRQRPGGEKITPWRGVVIADATAFSDLAIERSQGNEQLAADLIGWLLEDEALSGNIEREVDIRIVHSRSGEEWIFYGTTLGAPLLVLLFGLFRTRARRSTKSDEEAS